MIDLVAEVLSHRMRQCESPPCEGPSVQNRLCNVHPCRSNQVGLAGAGGQWSCWTDWSDCSVSCGVGVRSRTRECLGPEGCEGPRLVRETCEMPAASLWPVGTHGHVGRLVTMIINNIGRDSVFNMVTDSVKDPAESVRDCLPDWHGQ